jgi:hypothetical protein
LLAELLGQTSEQALSICILINTLFTPFCFLAFVNRIIRRDLSASSLDLSKSNLDEGDRKLKWTDGLNFKLPVTKNNNAFNSISTVLDRCDLLF